MSGTVVEFPKLNEVSKVNSMNMARFAALLFGSLSVASVSCAQSAPREALLAISKRDHTLAIVDPATLKIVGRAPVGDDPHEVIASADGKTAYISNYGGGAFHTLTPVDVATQKALPVIDLGPLRGPHGLHFAGGKVWFTAEGAKVIGSYDPATNKVDWVLGTGQNRTHMIFVAEDLKLIITTNVSSGTVSIIEKTAGGMPPPGASGPPPGAPPRGPMGPPGGDWNQTLVAVGSGSEGFDVSPDGKEVWAANSQDGKVNVIDIASKKVVGTITANMQGANRLKFSPDGKLAFISSLRGSEVAVIDAASRKVAKRIKVGRGAAGIVMQPDGSRAFVACTPDGYVAVIDLKSLEVTGHIDVGPEPDGLAWAVER
jgi:YVTN family beta-propeller protein